VKNLLVFVPTCQTRHFQHLPNVLLAFACFCLCASGVYIINDLLDRETDRRHPFKKDRPFASGLLSLRFGAFLAAGVVAASFTMASSSSPRFFARLVMYFLATCAYSLYLKRLVLVDVLALTFFFVVRVASGADAIGQQVSPWMAAFCVLDFLGLAMLKRFLELQSLIPGDGKPNGGRGYLSRDRRAVRAFGMAAGCLSVLVLALYSASQEARELFQSPHWLASLCFLQLFWIARLWLIANREKMEHKPFLFTIRDPYTYGLLAAGLALRGLAR